MIAKIWPLAGCLLLCACAPRSNVSNETVLLDEEIPLTPTADEPAGAGTRTLKVPGDATVVAFVDEQGTDIALSLVVPGHTPAQSVTVENRLHGHGLEIATLDVEAGAPVVVKVAGVRDSAKPGRAHARVQAFARDADRDPTFGARVRGFRSWSLATNVNQAANDAKPAAPAAMQSAIDSLAADPAEAALAAEARLVHAHILQSRRVDARAALAEARAAAQAFGKLPHPDASGAARAHFLEALVLIDLMDDPKGTNPNAEEAMAMARNSLSKMADDPALALAQRADAHAALGQLAFKQMNADLTNNQYAQALGLYRDAGDLAGVRDMRCQLAIVLVEQGRFVEGTQAFEPLLPELDRIPDPQMRASAYVSAARALSFSNRYDDGADLLLKVLPLTREQHLTTLEAEALNGLGNSYQQRGDTLQATAFYNEALNLARDGGDPEEYVISLASTGRMARGNGDFQRALELHTKAVNLAASPMQRARTRFDLAMDYYRLENLPKAIEVMREGLAVDLGDPMHNARSDGKLGLALFLAESPDATAKDFDEAARLVHETIATCERAKDDWRLTYAMEVGAQVDAGRGRIEQALKGFEAAIERGERSRLQNANAEARSTLTVTEKMALMNYLDLVLADVARRGAGQVRAATPKELAGLQRLERARQQTFGGFQAPPDAPTNAKIDAILAQMAGKSLRIAALIGDERANAAELRQLRIDMARLHTEIERVRESGADPAATKVTSGSGQVEPWRALAPGEVQLSYALGMKSAFVLARSQAGARVTVLPMARKELEALLTRMSAVEAKTSAADIEKLLAQISAALLPPGLLPDNSRSIEIAAEGRVASVPFAALRSPADVSRRLIETHDVAMVTSLLQGVTTKPGYTRPYRFVALASGTGTYRAAVLDPAPALRAATKEIQIAAQMFSQQDPAAKIRLFTGADGNAAALRDIWASGADVVHFATHALADLSQPIASLLVLPATDAGGKSTYLTAGQVQGWRGDVDLVFLSACESAIGPPQYASGMPGLQRAFLRAGARNVIATLTPVEDVLAQQFAADFYTQYTAGVPAARALGETQRAWLVRKPGMSEEEMARRRVTALSHAFFVGT